MAKKANYGKSKKKGFQFFWCFYVLFITAMAIFWLCVISYVKKSLIRYEEAQPINKMEEVMAKLRQTGLEEYLTIGEEVSRFETSENYTQEFHQRLDGKILFYTPKKGYQDTAAPSYELYADGDLVGYVTLKETSSEPLMVILTLSQWDVDTIEVISAKAQEAVEITVPDSYKVLINGQQADERELAGDSVDEEFVYAAAYVAVPKMVTYESKGLLQRPQIQIFNQSGELVDAQEEYKNGVTKVEVNEIAESSMPADLSSMVLEQAERYSNFFSADLPNCRNTVAPIRDMFPEDSYYLELADTYRREDMWMYSDHSKPSFVGEQVSHYTRYNDEFFSCEVYFEKEMMLSKTGKKKVDVTHSKLYYGLINGEWKILDIKTLLEE